MSGKVPFRKKTVVFDGAEFTISPLTFNQMEAYEEERLKVQSEFPSEKSGEFSKEHLQKSRSSVLSVIVTSLNNLLPEGNRITEQDLLGGMDDPLSYNVWREIMLFSGRVAIPTYEQVVQQALAPKGPPPGEPAASS